MQWLLSAANSGFAILVVIGLCLFFHETGHFLAAKLSRVGVHEFAMGFGPAIWRRKWGETTYALRIIPFGGFVRIAGMEPGERDLPGGLYSRPRWQIASIFVAGTFMNVVLALLVYWSINVFSGMPVPGSRDVIIRQVLPGGPAQVAGIKPDDRIIGVGGSRFCTEVRDVARGSLGERLGLKPGTRLFQVGDQPVATPGDVLRLLKRGVAAGQKLWVVNGDAKGLEDAMLALNPPPPAALQSVPDQFPDSAAPALARRVLGVAFDSLDQFTVHRYISSSPNKQVALTVLRGDSPLDLAVKTNADQDRLEMVDATGKLITPHRAVGRIGIVLGPELKRTGVIRGFGLAAEQAAGSVVTVVLTLKAMALHKIAAEPTGPIGIMVMTAETAKLGWASVLGLCGLISANLAVVNLFPIPPFDGYLIALTAIEGILRRRVNQRLQTIVQIAGFIIVINLFLALAYKDIANLIRYGTY